MPETTRVTVGDQEYVLGAFSTFKALRAGQLVNELLGEVPDLTDRIAEFNRKYREENSLKISRATAELRYPPEEVARISDEAWAASGGMLEIPNAPGPLEIAAQVFPFVFAAAQDRVLALLALVIVPNSELREADEQGNVEEVLEKARRRLVHEDVGSLIDLAAAAGEVLGQQFEGKAERLSKLAAVFGLSTPTVTTEDEPTSPTSRPDTSTDSPEPTAGPEPKHSTETRSPSSLASLS